MKRLVKHWFAWIRGSDEGSGTISGVALIAVAAIMLGAAASAGNLLLCLHRAQNGGRPGVGSGGQCVVFGIVRSLVPWRNALYPAIMRRSDPAR